MAKNSVQLTKRHTMQSSVHPGRAAVVTLQYDPKTQSVSAQYEVYNDGVRTRSGMLTCDLSSVANQLAAAISTRIPAGTTGFGWSDITGAASKVVKKVGAKKILAGVSKIMDSPAGAVLESVVPGLSIANETWKAANVLADRVRAGDLNAKKKLIEVAAMAKEGNVSAKKLLVAASTLNTATKSGKTPSSALPKAMKYDGKSCPKGYRLVCVPIR